MTISQFTWKLEAIDELKRLWADHWSCSEIALAMVVKFRGHLSRNAVIGKVTRLKLPRRKTGPSPDGKPARSRPRPQPRPRPKRTTRFQPGRVGPFPQEPPAAEPTPETAVTLMQLEPHHCRWPLGEPSPDMLFCGASAKDDRPYCAWHCRIAYQPARSVERLAKVA